MRDPDKFLGKVKYFESKRSQKEKGAFLVVGEGFKSIAIGLIPDSDMESSVRKFRQNQAK